MFEGDLWLNQKVVDQLLGSNGNVKNGSKGDHHGSHVHELTPREIEIIKLVAYGLNNKDIAKTLKISDATVRHHLSSVYSKLHIDDRLNLAIFAYQTDIVKLRNDRS